MVQSGSSTQSQWLYGRLVLYIAALSGALLLDWKTPFGTAEWLIEVFLAWLATTFGGTREMVWVAAAGTACMLVGLWTSPFSAVSFTFQVANRLVAAAFMWLIVYTAHRRRVAEAEARVLRGLLPICSSCKRIREADDRWQNLESYITAHSQAVFTHSLCPECFERYHSEIDRT